MQTTERIVVPYNSLAPASGGVAILNSLRTEVNGRRYYAEPQADPPLSPKLQAIGSWVIGSFPINGGKTEMFQKFIKLQSQLKTMTNDMNVMFNGMAMCGGFPLAYPLTLPEQSVLTAELYTLDDGPLQKHLTLAAVQRVGTWLKWIADHFDFLMTVRQMGLIVWFGPKACRMSYTQCEIKESSTRRDRGDRWETVTVAAKIEHAIVHDVVNATAHPFPADHVPAPDRVNSFVRTIPSWLAPYLREVDGTMIREAIVTKVIDKTVTTTEEMKAVVRDVDIYEPGIVLDHWVLAGWTITEVNEETRQKQEQARQRAAGAEWERDQQAKREKREREEREYQAQRPQLYPAVGGAASGCGCGSCEVRRRQWQENNRPIGLWETLFGK